MERLTLVEGRGSSSTIEVVRMKSGIEVRKYGTVRRAIDGECQGRKPVYFLKA